MKNISAILCGLLFGLGLAASGMTNTQKVLGFLDIFGSWIPDLALVMASAVITATIGFKLVFYVRKKPLFANEFSLPLSKVIDRKLAFGAALFGIGWGLYGYCPGPAIASMVYLSPVTFMFVLAMLLGMGISHRFLKNL